MRSRWLGTATVLVALLGLVLTVVAALGLALLRDGQEDRLLRTRTSEVELVLGQAVGSVTERLRSQGVALRASGGQRGTYVGVARTDPALERGQTTYAWLRPADGGFRVLAAVGPDLRAGQLVGGAATEVLRRASTTAGLATSDVDSGGARPTVRFALGPPDSPDGTVLLQQSAVGAAPSSRSDEGPFSDLDAALYATGDERADQLLLNTTTRLPLDEGARRVRLPAGDRSWLLVVAPQRPLVGSLTQASPLVAIGVGAVLTAAAAAAVEAVRRRRQADDALRATQRGEVERLQRALLPVLPVLPDLDVSARYLAGTAGQQVGGDWFDVFPLPAGEVGLVIGDVIGHDLAAAGAMAQVRAALRAYALQGSSPERVLDQLDVLVSTFDIAGLVTVVYGVLGPRDPSGRRSLRWCNAGHLPPLLREPSREVVVLEGAPNLLLGTPVKLPRDPATRVLVAGTTLLLYTDGLVEEPGGSLDDAIQELCVRLGRVGPDAEMQCEAAVDGIASAARRDDVAVLAVRLL